MQLGFLRKKWIDPVTGDEMSLGDKASWIAQGIIRRWAFVLGNIALSVLWWHDPQLFGDDASLTKWMVLYSLLAVAIESVVGIGVFNQTRRDALVLREVRKILSREEDEIGRQATLLGTLAAHVEISRQLHRATLDLLGEVRGMVGQELRDLEAIEGELAAQPPR